MKSDHPMALLEIFKEDTDEDHILSAPELQKKLQLQYGITICRQTLYHSINRLIDMGYEIETYMTNHKGYFLKGSHITTGDALLTCKATESIHGVSTEQKERCKNALLKLLSNPLGKDVLKSLSRGEIPTEASDVGETGKLLLKAINEEKMVYFEYFHYGNDKRRIYNDKPFNDMEPRFIVMKDSRYYLITSGGRHKKIGHYRIDRMDNVRILPKPIESDFKYQSVAEYILKRLFMFTGPCTFVRFRCRKNDNRIFDHLFDELGMDINVYNYDDKWFEVTAELPPKGVIVLAKKYCGSVVIVEPKELREELKEILSQSLKDYED